MNIYLLILLCVVQGLTEFLPVSSSGHLMMLEDIFGIHENVLLLNLFLHLATLFAVVIVYRKVILNLIRRPFCPLMGKLVLATIVTVALAGVYEIFDLNAKIGGFYGYYFIVTAFLLLGVHFFEKHAAVVKTGGISYKSSLLVGLVQGVAVLPGISRSGSTISAMIFLGAGEYEAAEFSFLLSIPVIIGGFVFELLGVGDIGAVFGMMPIWQVLFAFVLTFAVSVFALKLTKLMLKKNKFIVFSIYLFIIGIIAIII